MEMVDVTCTISTKNRYETTLPLCLTAIANQTQKPRELIIFDDGDHKDLRNDPIYKNIFALFDAGKISWRVVFGERRGQVLNHIKALELAKYPWIWRCDDDDVAEADVLEKLYSHIADDVGAIGGVIMKPDHARIERPAFASNKIEDIYLGYNRQWWRHPKDKDIEIVDHLFSSFLLRKSAAEYCEDFTPSGHREETVLTYELTRKGLKCIFDPTAITYQFCVPTGGSSTHNPQFAMNNEKIFSQKMMEWGIKPSEYSFTAHYHGIGDHFAFKSVLPNYFEKYKGKKHIFFTTYPEIFEDIPNIVQGSMADGEAVLPNIEKYDEYKFMVSRGWDKHITWAFKEIYKLPGEIVRGKFGAKDIKKGEGNEIIISPYSQNDMHPKTYPYWNKLIMLLKSMNYKLIQTGRSGEKALEGVDRYCFDYKFKDLITMVSTCKTWLSVDNFFPHMVNTMDIIVPGIVLFSMSDPKIFGYHYNKNILKSVSNLRTDQFGKWDDVKRIDDSFESADNIFSQIQGFL